MQASSWPLPVISGSLSSDQSSKSRSRILLSADGSRISSVFQEDRLLDTLSPVDNICLVCGDYASRQTVYRNLMRILPAECLVQPVRELSGGMKRRVAIARAAWYPSGLMILDEPFTGLDLDTKETVIRYLLDMRRGRTMLVSTHAPDDVRKLGATLIRLEPEMQQTI